MERRIQLDQLRRRLDKIDEAILRLLAERLRTVKKIAEIKLELGVPVIDQSREEEVRRRWIEIGRELSVPAQLASKIVDAVLQHSKIVQVTQRGQRWRGRISITIVGAGRMGSTLCSLFELAGIETVLIPARAVRREIERVRGNVVIFATRPEFFYSDSFREVLSRLPEGTIVMDILSVKGHTFMHIESLACGRGLTYISAHPLFGPLDIAVGENLVLIPSKCASEDKVSLIKELFQDLGLNVSILRDQEEHDRYMSLIQVAHHVYYLALMRLKTYIERQGIDLSKVSTHSLRNTLQKLERFRSLLRTLLEIQITNTYAPHARKLALELLRELVECLDRASNIDSALLCLEADPC